MFKYGFYLYSCIKSSPNTRDLGSYSLDQWCHSVVDPVLNKCEPVDWIICIKEREREEEGKNEERDERKGK